MLWNHVSGVATAFSESPVVPVLMLIFANSARQASDRTENQSLSIWLPVCDEHTREEFARSMTKTHGNGTVKGRVETWSQN